MASLHRSRRSRSQTPTKKIEISDKNAVAKTIDKISKFPQNHKMQFAYQNQTQNGDEYQYQRGRGSIAYQKTSAELISEARTLLVGAGASSMATITGVGGVRLLSTRRPITPRDPRRQLYGKVAPAGRPPSAFSLRYLQAEGRTALPTTLEPLETRTAIPGEAESITNATTPKLIVRSQSLDSRNPNFYDGAIPRKLPSLHVTGTAVAIRRRNGVESGNNNNSNKNTTDGVYDREEATAQKIEDTHPHTEDNSVAINILTSRKLLTRNFNLLAQSSMEKLIEMLKDHAGLKSCTEETVQHINAILEELYGRVKSSEQKNWKRGFVLGGLYGLVECSSAKILLAVARVVLALGVTGSNLTGACKLIFKVARNETNDHLFQDNDILELLIDGLGRASPLDDPEACIYGYGAVRFLTSSTDQERRDTNAMKDVNENWTYCLVGLPRKPSTAPSPGTASTGAINKFHRDIATADPYQKLSRQKSLVERLARHGAVELMVLHLQMLNEAGATKKLSGPPLHSLYQLAAALRALADVRQTAASNYPISQIDDHDQQQQQKPDGNTNKIHLELACPHLIRAAEISIGELEVQANIVRTLSVLSEDNTCCLVLVNFTARIGILLGPCSENFSGTPEKLLSLLSRLGYILGNIMARFDNARNQFYQNDVAMEYLLGVLEVYSKEQLTLRNYMGDTVIDVLVKLIRVVANMSVNPEVGFALGSTRSLGDILLNLLHTTNQIKNPNMQDEIQELLHATLGALHNLCFYQDKPPTHNNSYAKDCCKESKGCLDDILNELAIALCTTLKSGQESAQVEAVRVLGNLTRNQPARHSFCKTGGLRAIVYCLSNEIENYDLKASAVGVVVNLLGDWENRTPFMELKGGPVIISLLKTTTHGQDWFLAGIVCQAFWNLLIDTTNVADVFDDDVIDDISELLAEFLDEDRIFKGKQPDELWEQFAVVATDLLERIQTNLFVLNRPMDLPSGTSEDEEDESDEDDVYIEEM